MTDFAQRIRSVGWRWRTFEVQPASDARKSHSNDFPATAGRAPIRSPSRPTVPAVKPAPQVCEGGPAMWIVFYIATIASLSALGLAPNVVPETKDDDSDA
jgi:hypothetical protein